MLDAELQRSIVSKADAFKLMQVKPSIIKRPVIETDSGSVILGFNEEQLSELLK
jgi:arsenate reductase-like glutaredoxin family protein